MSDDLIDDLSSLGIQPVKVSYTTVAEMYMEGDSDDYCLCNMVRDNATDEFLLALSKCRIGNDAITHIRVFKDHVAYGTTSHKVIVFHHKPDLSGGTDCSLYRIRIGVGLIGVKLEDSTDVLDSREEHLLLGHTGTRRFRGLDLHLNLLQERDFDIKFSINGKGPLVYSFRDYELKHRHFVTELKEEDLKKLRRYPESDKLKKLPAY